MCTVVFLRRPNHRWPLMLAANRDELSTRPWQPPGQHWPDRKSVIAGTDELAGGTWLGMNDDGVVAGVLNRKNSLGPDPALRSRGELPLEALDHADAVTAAEALSHIDPRSYRSFNLFVADSRDAYWLSSTGPDANRVKLYEIPDGISMLTAWDLDSDDSARTTYFRPSFDAATPPDPETGDWKNWERLMASRQYATGATSREAMFVTDQAGFGTLSTSLIALESPTTPKPRNLWRFYTDITENQGFTEITV
jgi:hypothetical protein